MDELHLIDYSNPDSVELLRKAYDQVYAPAIPVENRESFDDWLANLEGQNDVVAMTAVIAGDGLGSSKPNIKGLTVGYHYKGRDANIIAYAMVKDGITGSDYMSLQGSMLNMATADLRSLALRNGSRAEGAFIELPDEKVTLGDFAEFGAKVVAVDYVAPAYSDEGEKNRYKLAAFPATDGSYPDKAYVRRFIRAIYDGLSDFAKVPTDADPDFNRMMGEIDSAADLYPAASSGGSGSKYGFNL